MSTVNTMRAISQDVLGGPEVLREVRVERPEPGEVIFADDVGMVLARRWCWRQNAQSAAQADTTSAIITVEAHHDRAHADIEAALKDLTELVRKYAGGRLATGVLSAENPALPA